MQEDQIPKVFISYSWSSDAIVVPLAERLVAHGIDVVLDKWDLKEGQDKYTFMEQCVNNTEITKVLIISDRKYALKANSRAGGVGDETIIISGEMYGRMKQEKFIPIIAERDAEGNPLLPAYIKSRIYIDLSSEETYEAEYEKLLRNIYEKPLYRKPKLGNRPEWLDEEKTNLFPLTDLIRQIKGSSTGKKQLSCVVGFINEYIKTLKEYFTTVTGKGEQVYTQFVEMKQIRDVFLDFLPALSETELSFSGIICDAFEQMYNTLTNAKGFDSEAMQASDDDYEIYHIHIWELFICLIAFLRDKRDYKAIHEVLTHTYFLTESCLNNNVAQANYCEFRFHSRIVEEVYKPTIEKKSKFTLLGDTIYNEREKLPIYSKEAIAEADLFLYQVCNALELVEGKAAYRKYYWFPTLYVYAKKAPEEWAKIRSRQYCEKMYVLFGVTTIEELKEALKNCQTDKDMHYQGSFDRAPGILSYIELEDIGSVK